MSEEKVLIKKGRKRGKAGLEEMDEMAYFAKVH